MQDVAKFDFHGNEVRVFDRDGEPWFVLAEVCAILEIQNPRNVAARLPDDEKNTVRIRDGHGGPERTIINEAALYRVVMRSEKPQAEEFQTWVVRDVLRSIRKTGQYADGFMGRKPEAPMQNPAVINAWVRATKLGFHGRTGHGEVGFGCTYDQGREPLLRR